MANVNVKPIIPQPFRLTWPLTADQLEKIDQMFEILFKQARYLKTGVQGASAAIASAPSSAAVAMLTADDTWASEYPMMVPGPVGATGVQGQQGPPGMDGLDAEAIIQVRPGPDYSEGTWTPTIGGSDGQSGQVYTLQKGSFVKIGQLVIATFTVTLSTLGTITTNAQIQGLPFVVQNDVASLSGACALGFSTLTTTWVNMHLTPIINTTTANLVGSKIAAVTNMTNAVQADLAATTSLNGTIIYKALA
jgi:hypothetical protein